MDGSGREDLGGERKDGGGTPAGVGGAVTLSRGVIGVKAGGLTRRSVPGGGGGSGSGGRRAASSVEHGSLLSGPVRGRAAVDRPSFVWEEGARARSVVRTTRAKIRRGSHLRAAGIFERRQERLEAVLSVITAIQSTIALGIVAPSSDDPAMLWGITVAGWVGILTFVTNTAIAALRALDMHFNNRRNVQQHMYAASELSHFITEVYSVLVPGAPLTMPSRATEKDHEAALRRIERASIRIYPDAVRESVRRSMAAFLESTRHIVQEGGCIVSLASETSSPATHADGDTINEGDEDAPVGGERGVVGDGSPVDNPDRIIVGEETNA